MTDHASTPKGEATRQRILEAALAAFRDRGFANATMRDIAKAAGMSLGAAYHYFESKDAIVAAYYEYMQDEHERRLADTAAAGSVSERLQTVLSTKLDLLRNDRKVLVALFATLADPDHRLSAFGKETAALRERSIALFEEVFADSGLSDELESLAGQAAWLAHLGVMFYFVHDRSRGQERTALLARTLAELFGAAVPLATAPMFAPFVQRFVGLARQLGVHSR